MNLIQKFKKSDKYTKYSIYIIILFSLIVLSLASIYHISGDGCWHIQSSKFIAQNHKFPLFEPLGRDEPFWSPPLYHIIVAVVYYFFSIFNHNAANFAIKFVSPTFGILTLIFSFLVIRKLANSKIAFYSAIFLAFTPIFIDYSVLSYLESTMMFFVILSIYFLINGKIALSGISVGLSALTKYNGFFIVPVLLFILYKKYENKKLFLKKSLILIVLLLLVASPWLIRNWALLGNPVWPFVNFVFHGLEYQSYSQANFQILISKGLYISTYLGTFGVPDGNYHVFSLAKIPYFNILIFLWLLGTIIFVIPLIIGCFRFNNHKSKNYDIGKILLIWNLPYLILFITYAANVGPLISRIVILVFPALAILWAFGLDYLNKGNFGKLFSIVLVFVVIGLVSSEYIKIDIAVDYWNRYNPDFDWVKSNTSPTSVFAVNGQCIPYNIERTSLYVTEENLNKADYVWANQDFLLDRKSILNNSELKLIQSQNLNRVYSNKDTGTSIYSTRRT
ncbi:MAG: glycosyltransferase family 39 protein [Nanoarchaeota archaeon]